MDLIERKITDSADQTMRKVMIELQSSGGGGGGSGGGVQPKEIDAFFTKASQKYFDELKNVQS